MVFPYTVDLEVAASSSLIAKPELLGHPSACGIAGDDGRLDPMEMEFLEGEAGNHDEGLRNVPTTGLSFVDPIPDVGVLERSSLDRVEVDLSGEDPLDEHTESVAGPELPLTLTGRTS